jgi:hypothetical protein
MISLVIHELGHGWALMRYGLGVGHFGFIPVGAIITPARKWDGRYQEAVMALMGPIWGSLVAVAIWPLVWLTGNSYIADWLILTVIINLFNLIPINPLDGGRVIKSVSFTLSSTFGWTVQILGLAGALALIYFGYWLIGALLFWFAIRELRADFQSRAIDSDRRKILKVLGPILGTKPKSREVIEKIIEMSEWDPATLMSWIRSKDVFTSMVEAMESVGWNSQNPGSARSLFLYCVSEVAYLATGEHRPYILFGVKEQVTGRYMCMVEDDNGYSPLFSLLNKALSLTPMSRVQAITMLGGYLFVVAALVAMIVLAVTYLGGSLMIFGG